MNVRLKKVLGVVLVIALLVGGFAMSFRAGYSHGVMADISLEELPFAEGEGMMPYAGMHGMRSYHGYPGSFLGGLLRGLFFLFILGMIFRFFFGMRHYGDMHRMAYAGKGGPPWMHHPHYRHYRRGGRCWDEMPDEEESDEGASEDATDKKSEA